MAAHASVWTERFERAEALFDRLIGSLRDVGAAGSLVYPLAARSHLDFRPGRWPAALAGADESVRLGRETGQESLLAHGLGALAEIEAGLGRAEAAPASTGTERRPAPGPGVGGDRDLRQRRAGPGRARPRRAGGRPRARPRRRARLGGTERDEPGIVRYAPDLIEALWRLGDADECPRASRSSRARATGRCTPGRRRSSSAGAG